VIGRVNSSGVMLASTSWWVARPAMAAVMTTVKLAMRVIRLANDHGELMSTFPPVPKSTLALGIAPPAARMKNAARTRNTAK